MVDVAGLAAPIWRQFNYLINYKTNFDTLQKQIDKLKNKRDEVQHMVTAAERNVEEIKLNVKNWQKSVEKTITEAERLIEERANNPRFFKGLCPIFIIHYKQSRKAFILKCGDIDPLLWQEEGWGPVSYLTNPPEIWLRSSEDYLVFESRKGIEKNVFDALIDENVFMIGVYGMGGLGKTTLVQEIGRNAQKNNLFEEIVFVEVSESPDIKKIQTAIADNLGLKFENEREMEDKLYIRMKDKNILLILDNIWQPLELDKTGIPCGFDRGRNKLLFTSRDVGVLQRMGSTKNFKMDILNEEEAWTLFAKVAGDVQTPQIYSLPNEVYKKCGGLPITICTIAKTLKNKSHPSNGKDVLEEPRAPSPIKFNSYLEKEHMNIALSYQYLRDDELKKTFLIASLLENNTSISDLFKHVVCLDILKEANLTMENARYRLDKLVYNLKDACLLLDGIKSGQFAMHDIVRAVAIKIAYMDHHMFTMRNDVEWDWNYRDKLEKFTKISFLGNSAIISQLWPNNLDCPNLDYLYIANICNSSLQIPDGFFTVMLKLRVLSLVGLQQSSLPSSIDLLTNLQTLCLDYSKVKDFAIIGELKTLKVLSLQFSCIEEFPPELSQLTQLRLLDLSNCRKLEVITPNVISQLFQLEEFYIKGCPIKWKHEVLEELKLFSKLTSLELDIGDNIVLPKNFFSKHLERYKISIGNSLIQYPISFGNLHEISRILELQSSSTINLEEICVLKNVEVLRVAKSSYDAKDLNEMQNRPLFNEKVIFNNLMGLELFYISFGKIWESQHSTSYQNLTRLILKKCDKIKHVFPFSIVKSLQQLQYLEIIDCKVLEKIVEEAEEGTEVVDFIFPCINHLMLRDLPKLTVFYLGLHVLELPILKTLRITHCPNFTSIYEGFQDNHKVGEVQVSELKSICLENKVKSDLEVFEFEDGVRTITWGSQSKTLQTSDASIPVGLLWKFDNLKVLQVSQSPSKEIKSLFSDYFQNLEVLNISFCDNLMRLITSSMAKSLVQLREMNITVCNKLNAIVEDAGDSATTEIVFDHLNKLSLKDLHCLECFCSGNYSFNFPFLKELTIEGCPNMKTFSEGILGTPELHNVNCEGKHVELGVNDLNTTIQQACKKWPLLGTIRAVNNKLWSKN